ncbi:MAG: hypothetical protein KGJ34_01090 [Patescibacteria group bacterium]|nr:hypothetical protein [Patescibacteria group bacterium]
MSTIEQRTMATVRLIYFGRLLMSRTALESYFLALSLLGIASFVSVPHVLQNLSQVGVGGSALFLTTAIAKTKLLVQGALFIAAVAFLALLMDICKALQRIPRLAH